MEQNEARRLEGSECERNQMLSDLIAALGNRDRSSRLTAAEALGGLRDARAIGPLSTVLNDSDIWVVRAAVTSLGEIGDTCVIPRLVEILRTARYHERARAYLSGWGAYYSGWGPYPSNPDEDVECWRTLCAAAEALRKLGGDDIPWVRDCLHTVDELQSWGEKRTRQSKWRTDGSAYTLRGLIMWRAEKMDCVDDIECLSDLNAVRFIQQKEGYTPCFGGDVPLHSRGSVDPRRCGELTCDWRSQCDLFRVNTAVPLVKFLPDATKEDIDRTTQLLLRHRAPESPVLPEQSVGVKIRSFGIVPSVSRKMLVAAPVTVFSEATGDPSRLSPVLLDLAAQRYHPGYGGGGVNYDWTVLLTADVVNLRAWLADASAFFDNGSMAYWPIIKRSHTSQGLGRDQTGRLGDLGRTHGEMPSPEELEQQSFHAPHFGFQDGEVMLTDADFAPILNIQLPILENIDFNTLAKLMEDFPVELCSFRDFLHSSVEQMRSSAVGSESFSRDCQKVERDIRDRLRKLDSDYKKARVEAAISLTGCAVASWTLALYCILTGAGNILTVLGPGGIVYKASADYGSYLTKCAGLKDSPAYFLWRIGKTQPKK